MKKNILFRTGAVCKIALLLFATLIMTACDNGEDPLLNGETPNADNNSIESTCDWIVINPIPIDSTLRETLDDVFSENNGLIDQSLGGDTLFYVINSQDELWTISHSINEDIEIDFENQCVIWGRMLTPQIPWSVSSLQLLKCDSSSEYRYEVFVEKCTECWTALGYLYFWNIYPRNEMNDISLYITVLNN